MLAKEDRKSTISGQDVSITHRSQVRSRGIPILHVGKKHSKWCPIDSAMNKYTVLSVIALVERRTFLRIKFAALVHITATKMK